MQRSRLGFGLMLVAALGVLAACGPTWPRAQFPDDVVIDRVLYASSTSGLPEGCEALVAELTDQSATRIIGRLARGHDGWQRSPIALDRNNRISAISALGGCDNDGHHPLGDLEGAISRPGAYYKLVNGGEGIAIIVPRSKLAGWFYAG